MEEYEFRKIAKDAEEEIKKYEKRDEEIEEAIEGEKRRNPGFRKWCLTHP